MVNDQGSTVPKARGEKIRMKINIIKILLDILYNELYQLQEGIVSGLLNKSGGFFGSFSA